MNRKAKITLNLSAFALALATCAQFYTNYKIDQTLKQFPYHFKEQFTIRVEEKNSDFFTRDLIFSIQNNDDTEQTEFIKTKLIALPFAITAQSDIPDTLIKKLNNALNITIDKNTINSQFSVVGDYLQSDIVTEFRDITNTARQMETELTYSSKSGEINLKTDISGLNYTANSKIKGINGKFLLKPVGESYYDVTEANIGVENIDITLMDGEDSRFELENTAFSLSKDIHSGGYDLSTKLKNKQARFFNKNIKAEEGQPQIKALEITTKQLNVPTHITLYDQIKSFNAKELNLKLLVEKVTDSLFNNDLFELSLSVKEAGIPKVFGIKDGNIDFSFNNKNKEDAEQTGGLNIAELIIPQDETALNIKEINWSYNTGHFNLEKHLNLLNKYMPEKQNDMTYYVKDNADFLADLKNLTDHYKTETNTLFRVKNITNPNYFSADNITLKYNETPSEEHFTLGINVAMDKFTLERENVQFEQVTFNLPLRLSPAADVYPLYMCSNNIFSMLCMNNVSYQTYTQMQNNVFTKTSGGVDSAGFNVSVDTFPPAGTAQSVSGTLKISVLPQPKTETLNSPIFQMIEKSDINARLTVPVELIGDIDSDSENGKLKNGYFWHWLKTTFGADNPMMRVAVINNGQYEFEFIQKDGKHWINGSDLNELEKTLEQERLRKQEQETQEQTEAQQSAESVTDEQPIQAVKDKVTEEPVTETETEPSIKQEPPKNGKKPGNQKGKK